MFIQDFVAESEQFPFIWDLNHFVKEEGIIALDIEYED